MADIIFGIYVIFFIFVCLLAITPRGKELQQEYYAFRATKRFYKKKGIRWP